MAQLNVTLTQLEDAIAHLSARERVELAKKFSRETLMAQLDRLIQDMRKQASKRKIPESQIDQIIKNTRQEKRLARQTTRRH